VSQIDNADVSINPRNNTNGEILQNYWDLAKYPNIAEGYSINNLNVLFPIIEDKVIAKQIEKLGISLNQKNIKKTETTNLISIDEFRKIQLRTAKL